MYMYIIFTSHTTLWISSNCMHMQLTTTILEDTNPVMTLGTNECGEGYLFVYDLGPSDSFMKGMHLLHPT